MKTLWLLWTFHQEISHKKSELSCERRMSVWFCLCPKTLSFERYGRKSPSNRPARWLFNLQVSVYVAYHYVVKSKQRAIFFPVSTVLFFCSLRIFLIKRSPIILRLNNSVIPNGQHGVKCWTPTWWLLPFPTIIDKSIIIDFYPGSILIEATPFFSFIDFYRLISKSIFVDDWYRFLTNIINYRFIDYNQSRSSVPPKIQSMNWLFEK